MAKSINLKQLEALLRRKLAVGIGEGADFVETKFEENISQNQVYPVGTDKGCKDGERSCPGEYPWIETGQGRQNVLSSVSLKDLEARVGVTDEETGTGPIPPTHRVPGGMHLFFLKTAQQRKWIDDTVFENLPELKEVIKKAAKNAR